MAEGIIRNIVQMLGKSPDLEYQIDPETGVVTAKSKHPLIDRIGYNNRYTDKAQEINLRSRLAPIESKQRVAESTEKESGIYGAREPFEKKAEKRKAKAEDKKAKADSKRKQDEALNQAYVEKFNLSLKDATPEQLDAIQGSVASKIAEHKAASEAAEAQSLLSAAKNNAVRPKAGEEAIFGQAANIFGNQVTAKENEQSLDHITENPGIIQGILNNRSFLNMSPGGIAVNTATGRRLEAPMPMQVPGQGTTITSGDFNLTTPGKNRTMFRPFVDSERLRRVVEEIRQESEKGVRDHLNPR